MGKKRKALPPGALDAIERWAIKNCNTSKDAEEIMTARIKRVCLEIQETWTEREKQQHKVAKDEVYLPPMYVPVWKNRKQDIRYEPDEQE
tara:strand:- start:101 stop:370 length:270 start_codon:yes stop_codon:yes gene_type:complete